MQTSKLLHNDGDCPRAYMRVPTFIVVIVITFTKSTKVQTLGQFAREVYLIPPYTVQLVAHN